MTIKSIEINNFRSITNLKLNTEEIDHKVCSILLGKNESGKSNILKAISLLDEAKEVRYDSDCNKDAKKKNEDIRIVFELNFNHEQLKNEFIKHEMPEELLNIKKIEKRITILSSNERTDKYIIYLDKNIPFYKYVVSPTIKIEKIDDIFAAEEVLSSETIATLLPDYEYLTKEILIAIIEEKVKKFLSINAPKVIFWEPSIEYLINGPVDLLRFKDDTSISIPLRNIFHISGIDEEGIKHRIELIETDDEERTELSDTLSEEITKYINKVWPEHKISININIDKNMDCIVNIEDKDNNRPKYKMEQRSDGFKQFISILLNLSAENKAATLKNRLILLDEPEVHLHPSGIKYLRDELLKIAENNNLIVATHSIYMIDKINLQRHFSVSKEKSVTVINQIQENNPYEEEVIYESLGTSIFEHISPNMLIFEGKTDKDMFDIFSKKFSRELDIKNISSISANGVDSIPKYVKFFNGELVKGYVVVDSDKAGRDNKKIILKDNDNYNVNNTFEITDLIKDKTHNMTLEDLLPKKIIEDCLQEFFSIEIELDENNTFIEQIKKHDKSINEKELKITILKYVVNDIGQKQMTKEKTREKYSLYYEFIKTLYEKIHS